MKKKLSFPIIAMLGLLASPLHARTWTSADGNKTIDGKFISSVGETVKVLVKGRSVTFKFDQLSEADRKWVAEELARNVEEKKESEVEEVEQTDFVTKLASKLESFEKKSYKRAELTKNPEYFLIYFSASW